MTTTAAIYRCLYGEDYVRQSIASILPHVDRVLFCLHDQPWGEVHQVKYRDATIEFPARFDRILELAREAAGDKFLRVHHYQPRPHGEFGALIDRFAWRTFDRVVLMEPDQVFLPDQAARFFAEPTGELPVCASQVELWRPPHVHEWYRVPERRMRHGPVLWDLGAQDSVPDAGTAAGTGGSWITSEAVCHNFGFAVSRRTMFWKHMVAIAMARSIGDSNPDPEWYEKKWLRWQPDTEDLEISMKHSHTIPRVDRYEGAVPL